MRESTPPRRASILCIDDDEHLLAGLKRVLHGHFSVTTGGSGLQGLRLLEDGSRFSVIVSDMRMPGINGVEVLRRAKDLAPYTVRVLLTGQADFQDAIAAVNEGHIYRFLTKPCSPRVLIEALTAAVEQHRLLVSERVLLEQTLHGSIKTLTDMLALAYPSAFARASRSKKAIVELADRIGVPDRWIVEIAAMLSQIGWVTVPAETAARLHQGHELTTDETALVERLPSVAADLLHNIPRLEPVTEIVRYQQKRYDGSGVPHDAVRGQAIPWGARALKAVLDFDSLISRNVLPSVALQTMVERRGWYDPAILQALADGCDRLSPEAQVQQILLSEVRPGMYFAEEVRTRSGMLLVAYGQEVTPSLASRLNNMDPDLLMPGTVKIMSSATS